MFTDENPGIEPGRTNPVLIILQGVPGSGKSTFAKRLLEWRWAINKCAMVCSTDDFFMVDTPRGPQYKFQPSKLRDFHLRNQLRVDNLLHNKWDAIVDNTNIHCWEAKPYVLSGLKWNAEIHFIRCMGSHVNSHGVPDLKVAQMTANLEHLTLNGVLESKAPWDK